MNFIKENDRIENPLARQQSHEASREAHHEFRAHVGRSHYERNQQDDDEEKGDSSVLALTSEGDMGDLSGGGGFKKKKKVENPYDFSPTHKDLSQITKPVKQSKGKKQRRGIMGESKKQDSVPRFDKKGRTVDDGRSTSKLQSLLSSEWDSFDMANPQSRQDKSSSSQKQQKKRKKRSEGLSSSPKKQDKKKKQTSKSSKSPRKRTSPSSSSSKSSKSEEKKKETKGETQSSKKSSPSSKSSKTEQQSSQQQQQQQQSKKGGRGILRQESDFKQDHTHESLVRMKSSEGKTWEL